MYQANSIMPDDDVEIVATTEQPGYVSVRFSGAAGGSFSLIFGGGRSTRSMIGTIDRVLAALQECRAELVLRGGDECPVHGSTCRPNWHRGVKPTAIEATDDAIREHPIAVAGAGDPDGVSPDAPQS